jgi:hypothetical protein
MVRAIVIIAGLGFLVSGAIAELDLTPVDSFYEVEGVRVPNVTFRDGSRDVTYTPPPGWILCGRGNAITLTPPNSIQAGARVQAIPARNPLPATAGNLKAYTELALELAPREAANVEVVETVISPLGVSGRPLVEATLSYVFFGQQFRTTIFFLPREKEQVRFQFSSRAADFPPLFKAFRTSLYSMQGL